MPRVLLPAISLLLAAVLAAPALAGDMFVFFGTGRIGRNVGFSLSHFDTDTGRLTTPVFLQEAAGPGYFVIRPDGKRLYTCNSAPGGSISAYALDPATAKLTLLNTKPSGGGDPCYVSLDATGRYVMAANYGGGSICVYALQPDGSLGERTAFEQHTGSSVNLDRQKEAHAHSVHVDPTNRFVLAADLGVDKLFVYRLDPKTGALEPNDPPFAAAPPGAGPRHIAFSPDGRTLYVANELSSSVTRFAWDAKHGILTPFETVSALPDDFHGKNTCAEILAHPGGKWVYVTNRGQDSVAVFSVEAKTGGLTLVQHISTQGKTPRNCELDPTGRWLLVTNQDSNNAVVFRIDQSTGHLTQTGEPVPVSAPLCERFLAVGK